MERDVGIFISCFPINKLNAILHSLLTKIHIPLPEVVNPIYHGLLIEFEPFFLPKMARLN